MRHIATALLCIALFAGGAAPALALTDEEVKDLIIRESINAYPGNCPCPYNRASNGSKCGKRSAWSKPGGYTPICYPDEITPDMVRQWREQHGG